MKESGAMQCSVALCFLQSQWECSWMSYPVHQLSLNPGGLFSDITLTDNSHRRSICVCVYISVVGYTVCRHPAASRGERPVCVCVCADVYVCVGRRCSFLTTGEGHCYQSHILSLSLHQSSLPLSLSEETNWCLIL